jgi:transcriptional regulator with XRE-family HTH domain
MPPPPPTAEADIADIGKLLKQERERLGLRHADVQTRSEIDTSFISRVENDPESNPTISTLRRYAQALNKTIVCRLVNPPTTPAAQEHATKGETVTGTNRQQAIDQFLAFLETEGTTSYHMAYADLARTRVEEIANDYFPRLRVITDAEVEGFLKLMRTSIERNGDHGMIDDWKMTTRGIADYLLRPGELEGLHRMVAAECVIRLSGYTNHGVELYSRFRPTAQSIGDAIWVRHGIKLPYIKIPEPWTATVPSDDHDGYVTIWDFAGQQRALASRILCFLCDNDFRNVYIPAEEHDQVREEYRNNRDVLMRWSVSSDHVDRITRVLIVNKQELIDYLSRRRFNQSQTYKPAAGPRDRWFRTWKHSLPAAPATT